MLEKTFYDNTPFQYGYSSKEEIVANMNPLLKELIEEASRHKAYRRKIFSLFILLSLVLLFLQSYGGDLPSNPSYYFYIGYFLTPVVIAGLASALVYWLMRNPPNQVRGLKRHFKDQ